MGLKSSLMPSPAPLCVQQGFQATQGRQVTEARTRPPLEVETGSGAQEVNVHMCT